jgi:hypothetical protein
VAHRQCDGVEPVVFVAHPCLGKAHGPKAYHVVDGRLSCFVDYEDAGGVGEDWPDGMGPFIAAAGLDPADEDYRERLTRCICAHLGLPALHRDIVAPDLAVWAAYF